jgi:hypothetical protein
MAAVRASGGSYSRNRDPIDLECNNTENPLLSYRRPHSSQNDAGPCRLEFEMRNGSLSEDSVY